MGSKTCMACKTENPVKANHCMCCGIKFPQHTKPGKEHMCHIERFTVKRLPEGLLLEWIAVNADTISLNGVNVTGTTSYKVAPDGECRYVLRADNDVSFDVDTLHVFNGKEVVYRLKTEEAAFGRKGKAWIAILSVALALSLVAVIYLSLYNNWSL